MKTSRPRDSSQYSTSSDVLSLWDVHLSSFDLYRWMLEYYLQGCLIRLLSNHDADTDTTATIPRHRQNRTCQACPFAIVRSIHLTLRKKTLLFAVENHPRAARCLFHTCMAHQGSIHGPCRKVGAGFAQEIRQDRTSISSLGNR